MPIVNSTLAATQVYRDYSTRKNGDAPEVTIRPGKNEVSDSQMGTLKKVKLFNDHMENGFIKVGKAGA